ncbi:MAG TPA: ATP-binding cassette domain-containing protein, partial [Erysipelothrix sp.]|nr:ATP-binding cassette domain-containing protein [Erysipelothrix sp.]
MEPLLQVVRLTKYYGTTRGLEELSLTLKPGQIIGLCGHNGSGKTTLFRMVLGLINPTSGTIAYGKDFQSLSTYLGYMPEQRALYQDITITELLMYLGRLKKMDDEALEYAIYKWLKIFDLEDQKQRKIDELSKGNQQKVQFICALLHDPKVLILDEPLTGLDSTNVRIFKKVMRDQIQEKKAIILSSHQYEELEQFSNHIILLKQGHEILSGNLTDLKSKYQKRYIWLNREAALQDLEIIGETNREVLDNYVRLTIDHETNAR